MDKEFLVLLVISGSTGNKLKMLVRSATWCSIDDDARRRYEIFYW